MSRRVHVGVFGNESDLLAAVRGFRACGLVVVDVKSPYPVHGLDEAAGIPPSRLDTVCIAAGGVGLALALWFQGWASATDWPLNVGGKPFQSLPAFVPIAFEVTILFAGLATVAALLLRSGLVPWRRPRFAALGATDDRFVLVVTRIDAALTPARVHALFGEYGALRTLEADEGEES